MEYAIHILEKEKRALEQAVRAGNLMYTNRKQAAIFLSNITEIKKAIRHLKIRANRQ